MQQLEQIPVENQIAKQPPDLRFCRAWWLFKKALYPKLGNAALRVFLALEDRASRWNDYQVPMSLSTLGEETGVKHHTTLASGIRELEAAGAIAVTRQVGNSRQANIYALLIRDLIGDEQAVFGSRSNSGSGTNTGGECDCQGECQIAASVTSKGKSSSNSNRVTGDANICSNRKAVKPKSKVKVTGDAGICSNRNSHANLAVVSNAPTSAENDILEMSPVNSGSAKTDTVLTCSNKTNSTNNKNNWFNSNELNGVTADKTQPVKAKFDQRQLHGRKLVEHDSWLLEGHEEGRSVALTGGLSELAHENPGKLLNQKQVEHASKPCSNRGRVRAVAKPVPVQLQGYTGQANFEAKTYSYQPQKRNVRQLREEYFKRLSWAMSPKERMAVLFSALRLVLGQELGKTDFSGLQALVNEHGAKAVLAGILATVGKDVDSPAYFAYLRGVIRNQGHYFAAGNLNRRAGKNGAGSRSYLAQFCGSSNINLQSRYKPQLPIDLAKYTCLASNSSIF